MGAPYDEAVTVISSVVHPQGVFVGYEAEDPRLQTMAPLLAGCAIAMDARLTEQRALDWDITIQRNQDSLIAASNLSIVAFGCTSVGLVRHKQGGGFRLKYAAQQASLTMTIPDGLPEGLRTLVRDELVPWLTVQATRPVLCFSSPGTGSHSLVGVGALPSSAVPFVLDADGHVIAGAFEGHDEKTRIWILPHDSERPELWLAAALELLHATNPRAFPERLPWRSDPAWSTREESDARDDLVVLERRRERWEKAYAASKGERESRLLGAVTSADAGMRRLLTAQAEPLSVAAAAALTELGYEVTDEDEHRQGSGRAKAHDLNLRDPDRPEASLIAEVKGSARAALTQAMQHIARYAVTRGGLQPTQCWLIINHLAHLPPNERPPLLQGADEDLAIFAESGGLLIDTRDLFRLTTRVLAGDLAAKDARAHIASSNGRFTLPD